MVWYHDPLVWTIILLFITFITLCFLYPVSLYLDEEELMHTKHKNVPHSDAINLLAFIAGALFIGLLVSWIG